VSITVTGGGDGWMYNRMEKEEVELATTLYLDRDEERRQKVKQFVDDHQSAVNESGDRR